MNKSKSVFLQPMGDLFLFISGIMIFTYFAQQKGLIFLLSFPGLILSAVIVVLRANNWRDIQEVFGLRRIRNENSYFIPVSILLAVFFSILYRNSLKLDLIPNHFTAFVILAAMIGATEELIFRGYIQLRSREFGVILAVLLAALTHTAYKYVLFSSLSDIEPINMAMLVFWTMVVGLVLGIMKEISGSCYVPILFHVTFDILVYGDGAIETWWVFA